jgi:hypothetical protein
MDQFETSTAVGAGQTTTGSEGSAVDQAKEQVSEVTQRAQDVAGQAQVKVRHQIDQRSTQLGEQVAASALALRSGADELYRQGNQSAGDAAHRTAAQAERFGEYLQASDANRILDDVEDVARRNPWAVVLGGVIAGAAAARFLKASSSRRYEAAGRYEMSPGRGTYGGVQ